MKLSSLQIEIATADYAELDFTTAADYLIATLTNDEILAMRIEFIKNLAVLAKPQANRDFSAEIELLRSEDVVTAVYDASDDFSRWLPLTRSIKGLQLAFDACTVYSDSVRDDEPFVEWETDMDLVTEQMKLLFGSKPHEVRLPAPSIVWNCTHDFTPTLAACAGNTPNEKPKRPPVMKLNSVTCDSSIIRVYYAKEHIPSGKVRLTISYPSSGILIASREVQLNDLGDGTWHIEIPVSDIPELKGLGSEINVDVVPV